MEQDLDQPAWKGVWGPPIFFDAGSFTRTMIRFGKAPPKNCRSSASALVRMM